MPKRKGDDSGKEPKKIRKKTMPMQDKIALSLEQQRKRLISTTTKRSGCPPQSYFNEHEKSQFWSSKNLFHPKDVAMASNDLYIFDCPFCLHEFAAKLNYITRKGKSGKSSWCPFCSAPPKELCSNHECQHCLDKSFASHPQSVYWVKERNNGITPRDRFLNSTEIFWFECPCCLHFFQSDLNHITTGSFCPFCGKKRLCDDEDCQFCLNASFESHPMSIYWAEKNILLGYKSPRFIFKYMSGKREKKEKKEKKKKKGKKEDQKDKKREFVYLNCKCGHELQYFPSYMRGCRFCAGKLCGKESCVSCYNKSFAKHPRSADFDPNLNGGLQSHEVAISSNKKFNMKCATCKHLILYAPHDAGCAYCDHKIVCGEEDCDFCLKNSFESHPRACNWSQKKNGSIKPIHVPKGSNKKFWMICDDPKCNSEFLISLNMVLFDRWCSFCRKKTERKLHQFLIEKYSLDFVVSQPSYIWCMNSKRKVTLPFDFELFCSIIVELDGPQHFVQVSNWQSPEITQRSDVYKMQRAIDHGFFIIRLLQEDLYQKKKIWQSILVEAIEKAKFEPIAGVFYVTEQPTNPIYDVHKEMMNTVIHEL
jgi:hypothetical protein